jgi:acetolactate synthase-1/2/3 large subunit
MNVSEYIVNFLAEIGVKHVFEITGGAAAHMIDAFHDRTDIKYVCAQHEQAAAMMADAYSRLGGNIGVVMTTSGPGATNLITGICCSYFDSIPVLYLTGQVGRKAYKGDRKVRQLGFQETDIISIVKPITKYAAMVTNPATIKYLLKKAVAIAREGRKGPVLLDIPEDITWLDMPDDVELKDWQESFDLKTPTNSEINECLALIQKASRPLIISGGGVRHAGATEELLRFAELTNIPVAQSYAGIDTFPHNHPLYAGIVGAYGNRTANFAVANCDLLLALGTRMCLRQVGSNPELFAREAKKIVVDIDPNELNQIIKADIPLSCDVKQLLISLNQAVERLRGSSTAYAATNHFWNQKIREWKERYPFCYLHTEPSGKKVNPYLFFKVLSEEMADDDVLVLDTGQNLAIAAQTLNVRKGQRVFSSWANTPMGYALPAAAGAAFQRGKKHVLCAMGDGGIQLNIQELQTIVYYNLPVKIFVLNNDCYGMVRQFQDLYFEKRHEASVKNKGYSHPDFRKVANAYGIKATIISNNESLHAKIREVLDFRNAILCEVPLPEDMAALPRLERGHPIEDQAPYLPRDEWRQNMIVKPYEGWEKVKE